MIASIDDQADIQIFLYDQEFLRLKTEKLEGTLIRLEKPKRQGRICLSVDEKRKMENCCFGIGIDDKNYWGKKDNFSIEVFLGMQWYNNILESRNSGTGTRHRMKDGAKINFYTAKNNMRAEHLEFYRDNKDKLRPELG